jgi:transposase-like protein
MSRFDSYNEHPENDLLRISNKVEEVPDLDDDPDMLRDIRNSFKEHCPRCKSSALKLSTNNDGSKVLLCQVCGQEMSLCPQCHRPSLAPYPLASGNAAFKCKNCGYTIFPLGNR